VAVIEVRDLLAAVAERQPKGRCKIVAVDGPCGAGKSTLARRLARVADAPLVAGDDFLHWRPDFDSVWPRVQRQLLVPLSNGEAARYQARDWHGDEFGKSLGEWKEVARSPLVVVEGVGFGRRQDGDLVTYRIWVDAPEPLRLERGLLRDGEGHRHLWLDFMEREKRFFTRDRTLDAVDLMLNGACAAVASEPEQVELLDQPWLCPRT
jgi:dephospho-CoA kinase